LIKYGIPANIKTSTIIANTMNPKAYNGAYLASYYIFFVCSDIDLLSFS